MKNLFVERDECSQLTAVHGEEDGGVASFCISSTDGRLYAITDSGVVLCCPVAEPSRTIWRCDAGPELGLDPAGADGPSWITSFSHVLELEALCITTRGGVIALLHVGEEDGEQRLEQVGQVDGGVMALEWSPDGEVLALLSGTGSLMVMNQAWELLLETPVLGASAALPEATAAADLYSQARISWRGDGKFFAVVCRDPTPSAAVRTAAPVPGGSKAVAQAAGGGAAAGDGGPPPFCVRVWDRTSLELHAVGAAAEGLLPLPAWQPNGRHLYVAADTDSYEGAAVGSGVISARAAVGSGRAVLLYERNGLRHGGFGLPGTAPVSGLAWSCDSELLAVVRAPQAAEAAGAGPAASQDWVVQVWHRSNWHWYLKHERHYPVGLRAAAAVPPHLRWDEQHGGLLYVVTYGGSCEQVALSWDTCVSDMGTAAVLDGARVLLTPMRHGLVPPPLCAAQVALPEPAVDVCITTLPAPPAPGGQQPQQPGAAGSTAAQVQEVDEVIAVLTSSGRLAVVRAVEADLWQETLEDQEALAAQQLGAPAPIAAAPAPAADAAAPVAPTVPTVLDPDPSADTPAADFAPTADAHTSGPALQPALPVLDVPLAGGRRARGLCWLHGASSLLVLAAPYPERALEDGQGDVVVQVDVEWVNYGPGDPGDPRVAPHVLVTEGPVVYTGKRVLRMAPHAAGGVALELAGGAVARYTPGAASLAPCGPRAALPAACSVVRPTPAGLMVHQDAPPLFGLSPSGMLCWGSAVLAPSEVTSFALRAYGPGGPALLYTSRKNLLYTVLAAQLVQGGFAHRELTADPALNRVRYEGEVRTAMHIAMRPDVATAAARDVMVRAVEAGASLVACPAGYQGDPSPVDWPVVLQMPRGNLEGVAPRALVLAAVVLALQGGRFAEAWRLATTQRVDLNLLVDYGWPSFLQRAGQLVAAVPRPADLCDLLFALRPGSVLADDGLYAGVLSMLGPEAQQAQQAQQGASAAGAAGGGGQGKAEAGGVEGGKVAAVCRAVREAVLALPSVQQYLEVVVTTYARSDPPQLESALRVIREAKERELSGSAASTTAGSNGAAAGSAPGGGSGAAKGGSKSPAADKALKHLLLYVDSDQLYGTALGMYDMPLAYMVVANAQKDPGEYLAELQRFASISPPALQRYSVDLHLRRHASALRHLVQAGGQHADKALALAKEHGLLRQLLSLYGDDSPQRPVVLEAYADQLMTGKRYEDAGLSYMAAGKLDKAMGAYRTAGRWRTVFVLAGQLGYDEYATQSLAAEMAEELAAGGQAADAAAVLLAYLGDVDNAVKTYTQAREWRESLRTAHAHGRGDLVETVVAPAAAECASSLLAEATEGAEKIAKYVQRLADVRARRLALAEAVAAADEDGAAQGLPDDLQSDVVSLVSGLSAYTTATGLAGGTAAGSAAGGSSALSSRAPSTVGGRKAHRSSKKAAKAGTRIRAGSPLEEASLVSHVHGLAPRPAGLEEASQLCELLVLLGHEADARRLQRAVGQWQAAYQEARVGIEANPVPIPPDTPPAARAEMERLLAPAPDTTATPWKWDVLRDFGV